MGFSDEVLQGSLLTEESIEMDLEDLSTYYDDMKVQSRVIPASQALSLPTLVAMLEPDNKGRERVVTHSFLPLHEEDAAFTKFLQFYCELQINLDQVERVKVLEALAALNRVIPLGTCILVEPRPEMGMPTMIALRYLQGYPLKDVIDQGAFTECLFLFDSSCDLVTAVLDEMIDGKSVEDALKTIYD